MNYTYTFLLMTVLQEKGREKEKGEGGDMKQMLEIERIKSFSWDHICNEYLEKINKEKELKYCCIPTKQT